jgi:hypothetical protein
MVSQPFDVAEEVLGRVRRKVRVSGGRMRRAATASALVEEHDPVESGIERPTIPGRASRSGSAMKDDGRLAFGIAASLPVDTVSLSDV